MVSFYKKIIAVSVMVGAGFIFFMHYDLLSEIPGFYCEGFGCIGNGIFYMIMAIVLIPLLVSLLGYLTAVDAKRIKAFQAFCISIGVMVISLAIVIGWNKFEIDNNVSGALEREVEYLEEARLSREMINESKQKEILEKEQFIQMVDTSSKSKSVTRKLNKQGVIMVGTVVDHNLEDTNIGGYVQIKLNYGVEVFVIYNPYFQGVKAECANNIATDLVVGDRVEVRGVGILELNSIKPTNTIISTCESISSYLKKI